MCCAGVLQPIFSMAELQAELAACQAVRWMYWKQRCAMTGEPLPPLYTEFGDGAQPVSISEGLCGVLKCLEANPEKFALLFQRTCDVRGVPDVLDIADVRGLLAQVCVCVSRVTSAPLPRRHPA
jgi:hypothetical protein